MRKIILITLTAFVSIHGYSQNNWSLRTNGGFASSSNSNGYYFSFDFGIPIIVSASGFDGASEVFVGLQFGVKF